MMYTLLDHPDATAIRPGMLRRIIYGAAPSSPQRLRQAIDTFGPVLLQSYGQSEAPGTILYLSPEDHMHSNDERLTSAGKPYPGVTVKLILNGEEVPYGTGDVGEICVRGPHVMMGYWNAPELTTEAFDGGWLHTGDMARMDADGFYYIVARMKDMIISGGFNVYASEVENALEQHPAVNTSAVIGVPDEKWGESVTAFVVLEEAAAISEEELRQFVRDKKGPVKTPKSITFLQELPLTKVGKVDKKVLRSNDWDGRGREVN
jgi:fatty-acyl-CoA synthase